MRKFRLAVLSLVACLPSRLKRPCYRLFFGYRIGKRVKIGFTLLDARECEIQDGVEIGHFNAVVGVDKLRVDDHARIGHLNILRGGSEIHLGRYTDIRLLNQVNSIPNPGSVNLREPGFRLGAGSTITTGHKIDFTDRVEIGEHSILGGRNSSLWTHNRHRTRPVRIGSFSYIGSEIRVAPGGEVPSRCIVGIGSVITDAITDEDCLIVGVPAKPVRALNEEDRFLLTYRPDLPQELREN